MVTSAQGDEEVGVVGSPLGARVDMVHVEEEVMGAAIDAAALVVATKDPTTLGDGEGLRSRSET